MIGITTKIHDKFSIEFKVGFVTRRKLRMNDFSAYMWIFIPNSLDINRSTYTKAQFYRDVKSNIRLITPRYLLREIASGPAIPLHHLEAAFTAMASEQTRTTIAEVEYQVKMFMAIVKSSMRDEIFHIRRNRRPEDIVFLCNSFCDNVDSICTGFRKLRNIINVPGIAETQAANYFSFGDEFISDIIEQHILRLMKHVESLKEDYSETSSKLAALLRKELAYRAERGYSSIDVTDSKRNRQIVFRHGVLKKYVESDLFLKVPKKRDGYMVEQIYYSIAAGLSMIFATIVSFSFQQKFGNFTLPLFIALVISYMLKDRIKELMRFYFAHKIGSKYFDNKATISIKDQPIGWLKEGMDFISEDKVPREVISMRSRSPLLEAENRISDEKIILYRKSVHIDRSKLEVNNIYPTAGINDIIRLHVNSFIQKMDNPQVPLYALKDDDSVCSVLCDKVYFLNIVLQFRYEDQIDYKRFRVTLTRDGIDSIEEIKG